MMTALLCGFGALSWMIFVLLFLSLVIAEIVNRTIDDTLGDSQTGLQVIYLPGGDVWKNQNCKGCSINPDVANAFEGTYTAATYHPNLGSINVTMQFNGTAVYIFFILTNDLGGGTLNTLTLVNFTLDGGTPQPFQHIPLWATSSIEYNQLAFAQTNLINAEHTLVISTSGVDVNVYVNFDYAIYTYNNEVPLLPLTGNPVLPITTSANSTLATDPVVPGVTVTVTSTASPSTLQNFSIMKSKSSAAGLIAGVIFAIALISSLIYFYLRRRRVKQSSAIETDAASHFVLPTPGATQSPGPLHGVLGDINILDTAREQLGLIREQINCVQNQKHSARVQGLSDDPPPGYTLTSTPSRY